jgi:hypothetical protein
MDKELEQLAEKTKALDDRMQQVDKLQAELDAEKSKLLLNTQGASKMSNSHEQMILKTFGCGSIQKLLEVNTCDPRFIGVSQDLKMSVVNLKKDIEISRMMSQLFYGERLDQEGEKDLNPAKIKSILSNSFAKSVDLEARVKAFSSTGAGAGDEFVPTLLSSQYVEEYNLERQVSGLFRTIPMGSNPFEMPFVKDSLKAKKVAEGAAASAANFGTGKLTFNAVKGVEYIELPEELNEDSAPAILDICRMQVAQSQIYAVEAAIVNGATGVHIDSDFAAAGADIAEKWWNGLRKLAIANSANGSMVDFAAGVTTTKMIAMRKAMGKFGVNVRELAWIVSPNAYAQMLGLTEVTTVDKYGPMATLLPGGGALAAYAGIPIIISENMRSSMLLVYMTALQPTTPTSFWLTPDAK